MTQDYDKDLFVVLAGTGVTTIKNFVDNVEDYIFGDRDEREATLLVPYTKGLTGSMDRILKEWAVGNYPIHAYVEPDAGHASISTAEKTKQCDEHGTVMTSGALEFAMGDLVKLQSEGNEVVVVVLYDEDDDVKLVGELKNYQSIPVLNLNGMIDDFPGFKTTDEILHEEREREEFETKEAIRIAAEKEQEKLEKAANAPAKKAAAAPRKRAAAKPVEDKPLTEARKPAPRKKAAAPKPVAEKAPENPWNGVDKGFPAKEEPEHKVGDTVVVEGIPFTKHSELPSELEPVKPLDTTSTTDTATVDVWADVARAQGSVDKGAVTHYSVKKENLVALGEGIKAMSEAHAKTINALLGIIEGK